MTKKRDYGLDILRIAAMLGVISQHMLNNAGIFEAARSDSAGYYAALFFKIVFACSVNVFAAMTGYLYISRKQVKNESVIRLIFIVIFYCVIITAGALIFFPNAFTGAGSYLFSLVGPFNGTYWYITSYIFMFFMIPYLNKFLNSISKKSFGILILTLLTFLSLFSTMDLEIIDFFSIGSGYSPFWLIVCYLIGAYIKLYITDSPPPESQSHPLHFAFCK